MAKDTVAKTPKTAKTGKQEKAHSEPSPPASKVGSSSVEPRPKPKAAAQANRDGAGYRRGAETRERLITAAQEAIHELGFNRASSREIARRSNVTFGVIQHHFGSYEAVLLAACGREGLRLRTLLANAEIEGSTLEERVASLADLVWSYVSRPENLVYMEIYSNLMRDPSTSEEARRLLRDGTQNVEDLWLAVMRKAFDQQEPDPVLRRLFFGTMRGLAITAWMNDGEVSCERERELFVNMTMQYLGETPKRS